jgi:peptide chain release factor 1
LDFSLFYALISTDLLIFMLDKLLKIKGEYEQVNKDLSDPNIAGNPDKFRKLGQKEAQLRPVVELIGQYEACLKTIEDSEEILGSEKDEEMIELAKDELASAKEKRDALEEELKVALLPKDPNDEKSVIMEIRAGTGGEEAALFASELARMYMRYAEEQGFKAEVINKNEADSGGVKEVIFRIDGHGAYSKLKYESGAHRVQRVPVTESQGRLHTSAVTVAVMPEAEEVDIEIKPEDLRIDVFRASGHGGQSVNTTDSAVRITHLPTNTVVSCQDEKSQLKNKNKAMSVLRARLYQARQDELSKERGDLRSSLVGSGDRSEKIRTYNFPQDRVTDHRIHQNWSNLPGVMDGGITDIIEKLTVEDQAKKLAEVEG